MTVFFFLYCIDVCAPHAREYRTSDVVCLLFFHRRRAMRVIRLWVLSDVNGRSERQRALSIILDAIKSKNSDHYSIILFCYSSKRHFPLQWTTSAYRNKWKTFGNSWKSTVFHCREHWWSEYGADLFESRLANAYTSRGWNGIVDELYQSEKRVERRKDHSLLVHAKLACARSSGNTPALSLPSFFLSLWRPVRSPEIHLTSRTYTFVHTGPLPDFFPTNTKTKSDLLF